MSCLRVPSSQTCPDVANLVPKKQCLAAFLHRIRRVCRKVFLDLMIAFCTNVPLIVVISISLYVLALIYRQYIHHLHVGYQVRHVSAITSLSLGIVSDTGRRRQQLCAVSRPVIRVECRH
jgi:hypothetical protein